MLSTLTVQAPGKLILSGEHAVVHGSPAVAMAINRYTQVTLQTSYVSNQIRVQTDFPVTIDAHFSFPDLKNLKKHSQEQYLKWRNGQLAITEVLANQKDLTLFTLAVALEAMGYNQSFDLRLQSSLPMAYGMGSSAALILSILFAVAYLFKLDMPTLQLLQLATSCENLQHGQSSGLDLHTAYQGGVVRYHRGQCQPLFLKNCPPFQFIDTGPPSSTTGECVMHSGYSFKQDPELIGLFTNLTESLQQALLQEDAEMITLCIRNNHQLLTRLGVVPHRVADFISEIEALGGSAKICGAGCLKQNDQSGIVLALAPFDLSELSERYGYRVLTLALDTRGVRVIPS